jgi:hypothetical protein
VKKQVKKVKKMVLTKETLSRLNVVGGVVNQQVAASGGPDICWFSDCNACDSDLGC